MLARQGFKEIIVNAPEEAGGGPMEAFSKVVDVPDN
jgi:hypothetical protein